jgi:pilus assembly protein CpaE
MSWLRDKFGIPMPMRGRFVIVSSSQELAGLLSSSLRAAKVQGEWLLFRRYPTAAQLRRLVSTSEAPVVAVIIGLTETARATRLIEDFSNTHPDVLLVAADTTADADKILAAMRAGASEFLAPPFDLQHLVNRFQQQSQRSAPARTAGQLLCFMPAQGGNGASTVALHVADAIRRELAQQGKQNGQPPRKPLLVDFDFHAGTVAFRLRIKPEYTLLDAADKTEVIDELWEKLTTQWKGMDVLAAPPSGVDIAPEMIEQVSSLFTSATRAYPYVLVDLPTALYSSCRDLLISADAVYLVSTPEVMSLHLAKRRIGELIDLGLPNESIRLVLNRVGGKKALKTADAEQVVGVPVSAAIDNDYNAFTEAYMKGSLVRPESSLGRQLAALARKIMGLENKAEEPSAARSRWRSLLSFG